MAIQDTDLLLIENPGVGCYKIAAEDFKESLRSGVYDNYRLLVNKPDFSSRYVKAINMQDSVAPTDYMLVERSGTSYRVTGQQVIDYFPSVPAGAAGAIVGVAPAVEISEWDQSQDWVANTALTGTSPKNIDRAFDGNITKWSIAQPGPGTATLVASPGIPCSKIKVLVRSSNPGSHSADEFQINGVGVGDQVPTGYQEEIYIEVSATEFNSVLWSAGNYVGVGVDLAAVWVDDKMLVNPGIPGAPVSYDQQLTLASDDNLNLFIAGDAVRMVNQDGDVTSYTPVSSAISNVSGNTLTFTSPNKDLKYFNPGDVVQSDWNQSQEWSVFGSPSAGGFAIAAANGFNGNTANQTEGNTTGAYFSIPISTTVAIGGIGFFTYASSQTGKMAVYNGSTLVETVVGPEASGGFWSYTTSYVGPITEIRISRDGRAFEFAAVNVNGKLLVDPSVSNPNEVSVISTDTAANTMVVDGGTWANGDVVTAPAKSGTGNFSGNTGPVVDVTNSNRQWIDDDNRLGEMFYIKPASTVNGLASARSLAEAMALNWSSSEAYIEGDWVVYGGYYWRAMEYNVNTLPSANNFEQWLGFGPV